MSDDGDVPTRRAVMDYLWSLQYTIAAGTSQVQRNLIAERILGLPRS
jgi:alkylation response protein AidB-like acyl-CoA dehydrogenase